MKLQLRKVQITWEVFADCAPKLWYAFMAL